MGLFRRLGMSALYVVCAVALLSMAARTPTWQRIESFADPFIQNFHPLEYRDTEPSSFRWGAQAATISFPTSHVGPHIVSVVATAPSAESVIHVTVNDHTDYTFTPAVGVFRTYMLLVDAPWQLDTTTIRFSNDAPTRQGRELAFGIASIRLQPLTSLAIPDSTLVLLMLYSLLGVTVWRIPTRWNAGMLVGSLVILWQLAQHLPMSLYGVLAYLIGYTTLCALVARYTTTESNSASTIHPTYRRDIDGLRAVAILSVLVFHAFPTLLPGGNNGVDVFFVISGFLITNVIVHQLDQQHFSLRDFYARRIRRIFPALTVVLLAVAIIGYLCFFPIEYLDLGHHIAAGAGFFANFLLLSEVNYFDKAAVYKPLLHLWSLGIEEQFYIIWPLLLMFNRRHIHAVTITVLVASFITSIWLIRNDHVASFYLPIARMWELLAGAWLAQQMRRHTTAPSSVTMDVRTANCVSVSGFILILVSFWMANDPAQASLLRGIFPVVGSVCMIAAGESAWLNRQLLARRVMVWIGLISFPLYLWHWPLLSIAHFFVDAEPAIWVRLVLLGVSVLAAWLTYRFIEQPIRFGRWRQVSSRALAASTACVGVIGATVIGLGWVAPINRVPEKLPSTREQLGPDVPLCDGLSRDFMMMCLGRTSTTSTTEYVVIGDSHADAFVAGFTAPDDITVLSINGCLPALGVERFIDESERPYGCVDTAKLPAFLANLANQPPRTTRTVIVVGRFAAMTPSTNVVSNRRGTFQANGPRLPADQIDIANVLAHGLGATLQALQQLPRTTVVLLAQPPELEFVPLNCNRLQLWHASANCYTPRVAVDDTMRASRAVIARVRAAFPTVTFVDPTPLFCDDTRCLVMQEGYPLYSDTNHLTPYAARNVWQLLTR